MSIQVMSMRYVCCTLKHDGICDMRVFSRILVILVPISHRFQKKTLKHWHIV